MRYEPWEHNTQLLAAQKETKLQPNLLEAPSGFIHLRFIIENPSLLNLLAEQVENDPKFKKWMFELLKYSKKDKRYAIGASNAISALNAAKVSFSGTNLREVKIPYANLDGAVIDSKDLSDSDLTGVSFRAVWLRNSNLQRACLKDVQFGQCPLLLHKEQVSQILFSPNGQYLAISAGHLIYLWRNNGELCHTLEGHKDAVNSIDFSLNSALLASGSNDKTVRLWEISTGKIQYIFEQHEACISKVIFSPDGKTLASCDGAVRLWNIHDKKLSLESNREYGDVKDLAFSANGEILAFSNKGMLSARLDLYHISSKRLQSWNDEISTKHRGGDYWDDGTITRLMFNQNQHSPTLAFINQDCKTIFLWDVLNKETPAFLKDGHLADMAFHPKNDIFAYSTTWENSQVHLYDLIGKADSVLKTEADVQSLVFSDDGQTLALSSTHNTVEFWDIPSKKLKTVLKGDVGRGGNMAFSPDGGAIAVLSNDNAVRLFALDLKSQLSLPAPLNASKTIMARTDHELVVLSNGAIQLKNIISGQLFFTLHVPGFEVSKSHLSADGKTLACINSNQGVLQLWDMVNGKLQKTFSLKIEAKKVFHFDMSRGFSSQLTSMLGGGSRGQWEIESPEKNIIQVYFGSNNKIFAVTLSDKEIELRDLESGKVNFTLHHHDFGKIERVVFSPDKQNFVYISGHDFSSDFGSFIHTIHLYGRINDQLKEQHLEEGQKDSLFGDKIVYDVIFSPAGDVLASVWRDAVKLWNIATGKLKYFWERECHIALFSPNGQLFAVDNKHTIELWNILAESEKSPQIVIDTGEIGRRLKQGIFSSDSQYLIAFNVDSNTPWLWNHSKQHLFKLEGHTKKITSITIGFDNKIFISGSDDCTLRLWNECGECLAVLEGYLSPVKSILWQTHDTLVTNDEDGDLKCWRIIWQSSHSITCQLTWRDSPSLFVKGSKWDQSVGLSPLNYQLLQENGIVGELILDVDRAISSQKSITVFGSQLTLFSFIIPDERTNYFYGIHVYFCHKKDKKLSDYITCLSDFKELILALKKDVTPSTLKYYLTSENSLKHTNLFKENRYHSLRENLKNYDLANLQKNFNEYITYLKQQVNRANGSASYEIASQLLIAQCQVTAVTPSENNEDEKNAKTSFASRTSTPSA